MPAQSRLASLVLWPSPTTEDDTTMSEPNRTQTTPGPAARPLRVLVIEDDPQVRSNLIELLENEGIRAIGADDGHAGIELARTNDVSLILCDVRMPGLNGFDVLRELRADPDTQAVPLIFLTGAADRLDVRSGMALGADDYITKPFTREEVLTAIRSRLGRIAQIADGLATRGAPPALEVVVVEPEMQRLHEQLDKIAGSMMSVLILGETGVGKEVVARRVHERSARRDRPFVAINCAALSDGLIEAELFGHERGAYTGASSSRMGLLEAAAGGTVFLDEVGELPPAMQVKLLRVLEDRRVYRVGGRTSLPLDVRFVAATNRDLELAVERGLFRADLLYRLNGFTVVVPSLRERRREIVPLALEFVRIVCEREERSERPVLSAAAIEALLSYGYPGNVRELRNALERAVALSERGRIERHHLPATISADAPRSRSVDVSACSGARERDASSGLRGEVEALERKRIVEALERCGGNQTAAAGVLGISRRTLVSRLSAFALPRPRKKSSGLMDDASYSRAGEAAVSFG
jgi:two-component system response regulator AtoC